MASMVTVKCKQCSKEFSARTADRKRGWAKFCSKSCKAKEQESRTGQYRSYASRQIGRLEGHASHNNDGTFVYVNGFGCWDSHKDDLF
jgi:hypothetical protein